MAEDMMAEQAPQQEQAQGEPGQAEQFLAAMSSGMSKAGEMLQQMGAQEGALAKLAQAQELFQAAVQEAVQGGEQEEASQPVSMEGGATGVPVG
jgi:hypothetical protein